MIRIVLQRWFHFTVHPQAWWLENQSSMLQGSDCRDHMNTRPGPQFTVECVQSEEKTAAHSPHWTGLFLDMWHVTCDMCVVCVVLFLGKQKSQAGLCVSKHNLHDSLINQMFVCGGHCLGMREVRKGLERAEKPLQAMAAGSLGWELARPNCSAQNPFSSVGDCCSRVLAFCLP